MSAKDDEKLFSVRVTDPDEFHCFELTFSAALDSPDAERHPVTMMLHARMLVELIHECSIVLSDWQAQSSAYLIERLKRYAAATQVDPAGAAEAAHSLAREEKP
jgi:hypothetical protein